MRSRSSILAVFALVAGLLAMPSPAGGVAGFGDVDAGQFYTAPVQWMVDNDITTGTSPTCFSPADVVNRGQAAAFMWRMEGSPTGSPAHPFTDVVAVWQQDPISWMAATGITTGTTPTTYTPDGLVTRGEIAALLHRLAGSPDAPPASQFADVTTAWQVTPVGWMVQQQITTGTTASTFSPDKTVTRGEIATFFHRYKGSPAVTVNPNHPAMPACEDQVPGPSTTGTLNITLDTQLIQNHKGNIVIAADNITLDCAGHTISGLGGEFGIELSERTGVSVRNCHVSGFSTGISLWRSDNNTITNNDATDNSERGISLSIDSDGNQVTGNTATGSRFAGISLWDSADNNTITGNKTNSNTLNGIYVGRSSGNTISTNTANSNEYGITIDESSGNAVSGNTLLNNTRWGFLDTSTGGTGDAGTDNTYTNNTCDGNGEGGSNPPGLCSN